MNRHSLFLLVVFLFSSLRIGAIELPANLDSENLAAWCIVPFDAKKRGPAERAQMLVDLGIRHCAYDWRDEHIPQFEEEILQYKKYGIDFFAFWGGHPEAFRLFKKYDLHPQIWQMLGSPSEGTEAEKVEAAANTLVELAKETAEMKCKLALYNHGGWGGEPKNLVAVCKRLHELGHTHVGIVYNWHHGHDHISDWPASLALMKPFLHCLNLNGMNDAAQPKILPLAQGTHDIAMLKAVVESGYDGPIGILDHQQQLDSKKALQDNLDGLAWLRSELRLPGSGGAKPSPKAGDKTSAVSPQASVPSISEAFGKALKGGLIVDGKPDWRNPPITVECRVRLSDASSYNILVASDTKESSAHWEIFSMNSTGALTVYLPGATPDHVRSEKVITDNKWHAVAMQYAADNVKLWVDGEIVADQAITLNPNRQIVPGGLAFGQLVEGQFGMRGAIDEVRIRSGIHDDLKNNNDPPIEAGAKEEIGYWNFDSQPEKQSALPMPRKPLDPASAPYWQESINRDRIYDFYAKQALQFGNQIKKKAPAILPAFPGLDGGTYGHWGNQNDVDTWKDPRVFEMEIGSMLSGVFRGSGKTIPRAVSVRLDDGCNAVFDQSSLTFELAWKGPLVQWSDVRRGFMHGIPMGGTETIPIVNEVTPSPEARFQGLFRIGKDVVFAYAENGLTKYLRATAKDGSVTVSTTGKPEAGQSQWPERIITKGETGDGAPYAIDTLTLPYNNPWNALFYIGGLDFLSAMRLAICNIHGDVWICDTPKNDLSELHWKRFAAGLHQPLGLRVVDSIIHVMCRDQIVALHDTNGDDEADFYQCVSNVHQTSAGGHDFVTGLQRDTQGRWYFASGNQGLCRVSADGAELEVLASGFRNPNGLGMTPDGSVILTNVQEGTWTPASAVCDASRGGHFGAGGPKGEGQGYVPPMLYLPRGIDNSSGGQVYIDSERWGPVKGQWIHFSTGFATHFLVLREVIGDVSQSAAIPIPGEFLSGVHRGRFSPHDGQLYVAGAQGWGNYGISEGCLQRVRYTGDSFHYPVEWETRDNGVLLTFSDAQSAQTANAKNWFAQQWNYHYGPGYGSPEFSVKHSGKEGHDPLEIRSVSLLEGGKKLFIEIPQIHPVNQLHLYFSGKQPIEIFATLHRLGTPFTDFPGYVSIPKTTLATSTQVNTLSNLSPESLMQACIACHHPTQRVVGPPMSEIRQRYANNPQGIVKWAMNPENKNPTLPPMPSFDFLGEEKLTIIAEFILKGSALTNDKK